LGIDESRQTLEIGGTYYRPHLRGTGFNRRVKDMMLARAFDCGIRRVEFRVDRRNARSQAAMKKLGAVREGVLRADRITWTGHVLKEMTAHRADADGGRGFFEHTFALCSRLMQSIVSLPQPVVAEVDGIATAAGCQLVASCDLAIASDQSKFGVNGIDVGLF